MDLRFNNNIIRQYLEVSFSMYSATCSPYAEIRRQRHQTRHCPKIQKSTTLHKRSQTQGGRCMRLRSFFFLRLGQVGYDLIPRLHQHLGDRHVPSQASHAEPPPPDGGAAFSPCPPPAPALTGVGSILPLLPFLNRTKLASLCPSVSRMIDQEEHQLEVKRQEVRLIPSLVVGGTGERSEL